MTCKDCIHYEVCSYHIDEETEMTVNECGEFKNKAEYKEVKSAIEQIIQKKQKINEYWQSEVSKYRGLQNYSHVENASDNFLRGYNEAVEDMIGILCGRSLRNK